MSHPQLTVSLQVNARVSSLPTHSHFGRKSTPRRPLWAGGHLACLWRPVPARPADALASAAQSRHLKLRATK